MPASVKIFSLPSPTSTAVSAYMRSYCVCDGKDVLPVGICVSVGVSGTTEHQILLSGEWITRARNAHNNILLVISSH